MILTHTQTPLSINKTVLDVCAKHVPGSKPYFIEITPLDGCSHQNCFPNVLSKIEQEGGNLVHGWRLQILPRVLAEFQFHGVWQQSNGSILDITQQTQDAPNVPIESVSLFLPDPGREYRNQRVASVLYSLSKDHAARQYTAIRQKIADYEAVGNKELYIQANMEALPYHQKFSQQQPQPNDPCPCGSRKKYKVCPCHSP